MTHGKITLERMKLFIIEENYATWHAVIDMSANDELRIFVVRESFCELYTSCHHLWCDCGKVTCCSVHGHKHNWSNHLNHFHLFLGSLSGQLFVFSVCVVAFSSLSVSFSSAARLLAL